MKTIQDFFDGTSVLVTGGTGFLGKILIEKLVRSCFKIGTIYMIIRPHRGKSSKERLKDYLALPVFNRVKEERPGKLEEKLHVIEGDLTKLSLGISENDLKLLEENVSVIFHAAATVRFDQPIRDAILMNLRGTREVVHLAKRIKHFSVLVHVSTTYSNCDRVVVKEEVYPSPVNWKEAIEVAEKIDPVILQILNDKYLDKFPNSYTLTKNLAERLLWEECQDMPTVIFRPSIVISTAEEPMPGWIDNFNGPVGLIVGFGKGVIRAAISTRTAVPDYMPVDIAIKGIIVAAWKQATHKNDGCNIEIYNSSSRDKSISQERLMDIGFSTIHQLPINDMLWIPGISFTPNKTCFYFNVILKQVLPAIAVDYFLHIANKKPVDLLKIQRKYYQASIALAYFTSQSWHFVNTNFLQLLDAIPETDRSQFDYSFLHVNVEQYFREAAYGGHKYLLGSDMSSLPAAVARSKRLYWLDKLVKFIFVSFVAYLLVKKIL